MPEKLGHGPRTTYDARVGAGLGRGPSMRKKLNAAPWSGTWPAPSATLDLDFANDRGFVRGVGQGRSMDAVTFTRASNGTFVKPDGTLSTHANQGALGKNLLTFPQDFDNAAWVKNLSGGVTIIPNTEIATDGTLTADKLIPNASSGFHYTNGPAISVVSGTSYTSSVYAKASEISKLDITCATNLPVATFDLVAKTATGLLSSTATITELSNGWFRCTATRTAPGNSTESMWVLAHNVAGTAVNFTGDGVSGIFIWGAQLEVGSTATEYFPTNINQPRFDWASTAQVASKNLFQLSESVGTSPWTLSNATVATTSISGFVASAQVGDNSVQRQVRQGITMVAGTTYTVSAFVQMDDSSAPVVGGLSGGDFAVISDDATHTGAATVTQIGATNVYRVSSTRTATTGGNLRPCGIYKYTGASAKTFRVSGFQIEVSGSVTDYQAVAQPTTNTPLAANPTSNGLLIEESRANRLLWNRDATQTQWVKTNVTAAKDQTGIDGVANAASSLTSTAANGTCIQTITLASGSRTGSVFLKRITGTGNVQVSLDGSTWSTVDLSDTEWRRVVLSGTVTNPTVGIRIAVSGDAVAMDYGQVEDGANETTPILTTTAAATRSADTSNQQNIVKNWLSINQSGTFYCEFFATGLNGTTNNVTVLNLGSLPSNNDNNIVVFRNNGVSVTPSNLQVSSKTKNKVSVFSRLNTNEYRQESACVNGSLSSPLAALSYQYEWQYFGIGNTGRSNNLLVAGSFAIKRIVYMPKILSGEAMKTITGSET